MLLINAHKLTGLKYLLVVNLLVTTGAYFLKGAFTLDVNDSSIESPLTPC
jgi:hypothetical protein